MMVVRNSVPAGGQGCCRLGLPERCADLLACARACAADGAFRLTPVRLRVLEALAAAANPQGAYDLLNALNRRTPKLAPTAVYRALEFWEGEGFIHKIRSEGAWVACARIRERGGGANVADTSVGGASPEPAGAGSAARVSGKGGAPKPEAPLALGFLLCRGCGHAHEFNAPTLAAFSRAVASSHGFQLEGGVVELKGVCPACREKEL